jgi:hypothetical protein
MFSSTRKKRDGDLGFHLSRHRRHLHVFVSFDRKKSKGPHLLYLPLLRREGVETSDLRSTL